MLSGGKVNGAKAWRSTATHRRHSITVPRVINDISSFVLMGG